MDGLAWVGRLENRVLHSAPSVRGVLAHTDDMMTVDRNIQCMVHFDLQQTACESRFLRLILKKVKNKSFCSQQISQTHDTFK